MQALAACNEHLDQIIASLDLTLSNVHSNVYYCVYVCVYV